ncbi:septal ring lytic transglycosylase RlpA family protein [Amphritea balenae]|uniref:Endolytic peptidoglycan transglycosylase RlpA n=1 Tax=Amphritea balenae TaxID=452629 RepID=A0A3P1SPH8_9GAMM|nr:septal ring lytic transglycosylase RlpA family protein [Amphritea balenae]RRC98555.1 septal ring lytic transglycosylase RlpA family protein [Amphritea balenae]GGK65472.1 minor lipoprotein [Amphritea balenae]
MKRIILNLCALSVLVVLGGCSSSGGRYAVEQDYGPSKAVDVSNVPDAVPRAEPKSRGGNKSPYRVLGKTYYVMPSSLGYKERGVSSWYGKKFHGHKTSNGETYNMYAMTAAHKSLPLPSYVQVTNLKNGKRVIVRVNDRGPFHGGRIIDLSYAAASKLDMLGAGTAKVEVEAINPNSWNTKAAVVTAAAPPAPATQAGAASRYLQVGAFSLQATADEAVRQLQTMLPGYQVRIVPLQLQDRRLYRVQLGPVQLNANLAELISRVEAAGYLRPHLVD